MLALEIFFSTIQIVRLSLKVKFKLRKGKAKSFFEFLGLLLSLRFINLLFMSYMMFDSNVNVCMCNY